MTNTFA